MPHKSVHRAAGGRVEVAHEHGEDGPPLRGHHLSHGRQDRAQLSHLLTRLGLRKVHTEIDMTRHALTHGAIVKNRTGQKIAHASVKAVLESLMLEHE